MPEKYYHTKFYRSKLTIEGYLTKNISITQNGMLPFSIPDMLMGVAAAEAQ